MKKKSPSGGSVKVICRPRWVLTSLSMGSAEREKLPGFVGACSVSRGVLTAPAVLRVSVVLPSFEVWLFLHPAPRASKKLKSTRE